MSWRTPIALDEEMTPLEKLRASIAAPRTYNTMFKEYITERINSGEEIDETEPFNLNDMEMK